MEIFKKMNRGNLEEILKIINKWWLEEEIPEEQLSARIVLIFKNKGNSNDIDNYRPIALTNSMYKIFTAIIQRRLCAQMDQHLQKTQYGSEKTNPRHTHFISSEESWTLDTGQGKASHLFYWTGKKHLTK